MLLDRGEVSFVEHLFEFGEGVGVAALRGNEHNEAERRGVGRRDAVGVGNELDDGDAAVLAQSGVTFLEKSDAGGRVEVVEEIREKDEVVVFAEVDLKGAAFDSAEAVGELHAL